MRLICTILPAFLCVISASLGLDLLKDNYNQRECIRLDAAISFQGVNYLFSGKHFVQLDHQNREIRIRNIYEEWGNLADIDAALSYENTAYLFKGSYYFYFSYPFGMVGPLSNYRWGAEIGNRLDAAVSGGVNGSMFLKDCKLYEYNDGSFQNSRELSDDDIPCTIDAALSMDDDGKMALIKYDQVWYISGNGSVSGPFNANDEFHLSMRFCKEREVDYKDLIKEKESKVNLKPSLNNFDKSTDMRKVSTKDDMDLNTMWKNKFSKYWKPSKSSSSSSSSSGSSSSGSSNSGLELKKRHYFKNSKISEMVELKKTRLDFMIEGKKARLDSIDNVDDKQDVEQMIEQGEERIEQLIEHAGERLKSSGLSGAVLDQALTKEESRLGKIIDDDERVIDEILARLEAEQYDDDDDDDSIWDK